MTQNIAVTPGSGATIAADLVGSALMQQLYTSANNPFS
jgi:hypothetical protein